MIKWANVFISMILEALPFILIGSIASSVIQIYVSENVVKRILPKSRIISIIFAAFMGVFIPICECAIVPIARSLIKKGVPIAVAVVFMLTVPIVNPIVVASTFYAFKDINIVLIRVFGGIICAIIIGLLVEVFTKKNNQVISNKNANNIIIIIGSITPLEYLPINSSLTNTTNKLDKNDPTM